MIIIRKHLKVLRQYYRDDPNDEITRSESFKYKTKITGKTSAAGNTKDVKTAMSWKYLSDFWRTLEMSFLEDSWNVVNQLWN